MSLDIHPTDTIEQAQHKLAAYQLDVINRIHSARVVPIDPRRRNHPVYGPGRSLEPRHTLRYYRVRTNIRLAVAGLVLLTSTAIMASVFMLAAWCFNLLFAAFS